MAFIHGKGAFISVGGTDLTPYANEVGMPRDIDTADTSHFGTQSKTYITGMDDSTVSIAGLWDSAADAAINTIIGQLLAGTIQSTPVIYGPAGNATGKPQFSLQAIVTGYEVSASAGDVVSFSLSLQRTGSTTTGAF
jgi:predicted secreted protein